MRKKKTNRQLKVIEQSGYKYKPTPTIILKGQWLLEYGFCIGDEVKVICEDGIIVIRLKSRSNETVSEST